MVPDFACGPIDIVTAVLPAVRPEIGETELSEMAGNGCSP
jgi:hypothetical protein